MTPELVNTIGIASLIALFVSIPLLLKLKKKLAMSAATPMIIERKPFMETVHSSLIPLVTEDIKENDEYEVEFKNIPSDEELAGWVNEAESVLLQESEKVIDAIQGVIKKYPGGAGDKKQVFNDLHTILREYAIFFDTEYYDAINHYVSLAAKRDLAIEFEQSELDALWNY